MDQSLVNGWEYGELQIDCIRTPEGARLLREEWSDLALRCPNALVYQTYEWAISWWQVHGGQAQLLVFTARCEGKLVGLAPLMQLTTSVLGRSRRVVQFIASHASDFMDMLVDPAYPQVVNQVLDQLVGMSLDWDLLLFVDVDSASPLVEEMGRWAGIKRYAAITAPLYHAAVYLIGDADQDRLVLRKKDVHRNTNALKRMGTLKLRMCQTTEEALGWAEGFFACHIDRWTDTDTPSEFLDETHCEQMRSIIRTLFPAGLMKVWILLLDGEPISYRFALDYKQKIMGYRIAYSKDYAKYSPGSILTIAMFEYAISNGYSEICLGVGGEHYKERFSNASRHSHQIRIYRRPFAYRLDSLLIAARDLVQPIVERSPILRPIGLYIRKRWPSLQF